MPLSPYCWNFQGDLSRLPVELNCTRGLANGSGLPSSRVSSGLGSNVSTCDGPPLHEQKDDPLGPGRKMRRSRRQRSLAPDSQVHRNRLRGNRLGCQ